MHRKWLPVSICALALAGCQTMGGVQAPPPAPATPAPARPGTTAPAPAPGTAPETSPWDAARARGMAFRASGRSPGWSVEVQKSRTPTLFIVLDESRRHVEVPASRPFSDPETGTVGFRGTSTDGTPVQLTIHRGQCQEDTGDKQLTAAAELDVGASQYEGCGKFLFQ